LQNPADPRYAAAAKAEALRREAAAERKRAQRNSIEMRDRWSDIARPGHQRLTLALAVCSIVTGVATNWGKDTTGEFARDMFIATRFYALPVAVIALPADDAAPQGASVWNAPDFGLIEVAHGEVWRLVTPIFLHFGIPHLLFNMLALFQLGGVIESRQGAWRLAGIVLLGAVVSNLAQYFWSGPNFGGMSGVLFALFGYAWMQSRYVPGSGLNLPGQTIFFCLLWLFACTVQEKMAIANMAHGAGLAVGIVLGLAPRWLRR
jgi:GlpG protein